MTDRCRIVPTDDALGRSPGRAAQVKIFRRAVAALVVAGAVAAALRVRGQGGVPPQGGGWQELPVRKSG